LADKRVGLAEKRKDWLINEWVWLKKEKFAEITERLS